MKVWNRKATYLLMDKQGLLKVSEAQIKANYEHLKSRYIQPEQVRAQQILIYLPLNPKPKEVKKGFDRAQMLHADLMKQPQDFDLFVQRYSEERLAGRKGDLGFFSRGEMVQSVEDTVFNLKENQIAPPVRSKYGWHILKKTGSRPRQETTLKELYPQLKANLKRGNFQRQRMNFLKELWIKSQIQSTFSVKP
jgi:parvulin-like peptidyl-prolyl isomerase